MILDGGLSSLPPIVLTIIGIILLILIIKVLYFLMIPTILAFVVWLLTKDPFMAGVAFLAVAVLSIIFRK
ncbi:MAG: hypothetical protein GX307_05110 [Euryarchaeota archaeon]|jgi:membrane protein implicated in regulation of membrane protease activity|nr:hypothetical protein [Euryarchaeota archaeon]